MKYRNLFWGVILILLGVLYLLKKFDVIWFNWRDIVNLWPLILVLWGISLLPIKSMYKLAVSFLSILAMIIIIWMNPGHWHSGWIWIGDYSHPERSEVKNHESVDVQEGEALLELKAVAGTYTIEGTTDQLVDFEHTGKAGNYYMRTSTEDDRHHVKIGPQKRNDQFSIYKNHHVEISLNPEVSWDIEVDAGAAELNLDLSEYIVNKLNVDGGATSIDIRLGSMSDNLKVDIETGVSSVVIRVPEEVACEVDSDSFLVSRELPGFDKVSRSTYVSPNFSSATKNISIRFESGISSLRVVRY